MEKKEISELFDRFTNEPDKEKRHAMIDNLTEEQAKLILKSIADFKYRTSTIERKSEPCFVWGTIFVQTKRHSLP